MQMHANVACDPRQSHQSLGRLYTYKACEQFKGVKHLAVLLPPLLTGLGEFGWLDAFNWLYLHDVTGLSRKQKTQTSARTWRETDRVRKASSPAQLRQKGGKASFPA